MRLVLLEIRRGFKLPLPIPHQSKFKDTLKAYMFVNVMGMCVLLFHVFNRCSLVQLKK